jgi:hypothetical protein
VSTELDPLTREPTGTSEPALEDLLPAVQLEPTDSTSTGIGPELLETLTVLPTTTPNSRTERKTPTGRVPVVSVVSYVYSLTFLHHLLLMLSSEHPTKTLLPTHPELVRELTTIPTPTSRRTPLVQVATLP